MSYNPAFSKVLYVVPTVNAEGDTDLSAAVDEDILAGDTIFSSGTTLKTDANGVSSNQRAFIPVNAPEEGPGGGGFDYGTYDQNRTAQRLQAWTQTGPGATATGAQRQNESHAATAGPDGSSIINVAVYGNVRT